MKKNLYIGIDLGDHTYSVDAVNWKSDSIIPVTLPGQQGNIPILTAVGRTADGPFRLIRDVEEVDSSKMKKVLVNFKVKPSSVPADSPKGKDYQLGIFKMLELTLTQQPTAQTIHDLAKGCSGIVIKVGYPTNWDQKDVQVFQQILEKSVLGNQELLKSLYGMPTSFSVERESAAALIYARSSQKELGISKQTNVLVLDFGSSTVNVTALTVEGRQTLYNSGHNFFGGRLVDCLIANYYIKQLTPQERRHMEDIDRLNKGVATALLLMAACKAKETLTQQASTRIIVDYFPDKAVRFTREIFDQCMDEPIAPIAQQFNMLPDPGSKDGSVLTEFGNRSWRQILHNYLDKERIMLAQKGFIPEVVIATGGGSLLPDTQRICSKLFRNVAFMNASNASNIISRGLAQAAKREAMSGEYKDLVNGFLNTKLPDIIKNQIPSLADAVSDEIANIMCNQLIIPEMMKWRDGYGGYDTLDDASRHISRICSSSSFAQKIEDNKDMQRQIQKWCVNHLGTAIAVELDGICKKYGVKGFKLEDLNVLKTPTININGGNAVGLDVVVDLVGAVVSVVAAIMAASISTSALVIILSIISVFMPALAAAIAEFIALIPGGLIILAGLAGVAAFRIATQGWQAFRNVIISKVSSAHIPEAIRRLIPESLITNSIKRNHNSIVSKVRQSISSSANAENIAQQIHSTIKKQISKKLNDILYALEEEN